MDIQWYVVEGGPDVRVQRGAVVFDAPATIVPLAAVDRQRAFPLISIRNNGNTIGNDDMYATELFADMLVIAPAGTGTTPVIEWQVVEFGGAAVTHGSVQVPGLSASSPLPGTIDPARSWLVYSASFDTNDAASLMLRGTLSASEVRFDRTANDVDGVASYSVVQFPLGIAVRHVPVSLQASEVRRVVPLDTPCQSARAVAVGGLYQKGGSIAAGSASPVPQAGWMMTSTDCTNVTVDRGGSTVAADIMVTVVEF